MKTIDIVFDGPPSHEAPRFVEIERDGKSIRIGEWIHREDGYWVLRIPDFEAPRYVLAANDFPYMLLPAGTSGEEAHILAVRLNREDREKRVDKLPIYYHVHELSIKPLDGIGLWQE